MRGTCACARPLFSAATSESFFTSRFPVWPELTSHRFSFAFPICLFTGTSALRCI